MISLKKLSTQWTTNAENSSVTYQRASFSERRRAYQLESATARRVTHPAARYTICRVPPRPPAYELLSAFGVISFMGPA